MTRPISVIAESLDRRRGGAETYLADLVGYLVHAGHPVRAYLRRPSQDLPASTIEVVPTRGGPGLLREWQFSRAIQRRLAGTTDVVFSTWPAPAPEITHYVSQAGLYRAAFEAERASFDPGFRRRFFRLGNRLNLQRQWLMTMQEKLLTREPRVRIMTYSAALRRQVLEQYSVPASDVVAVPHGVNLARWHPGTTTAARTARLKLLFVAHNFRLKGLHCALRALGAAVRRGLRADLLVAGNGPRGPFEKLARNLGLAGQVRFLGPTTDTELGELYRAADALVHPTFADHCSLVVLEALASGLPVITSRCNGAAELMESGREGFILEDPRDIEGLTEALLRLEDRPKLADMRQAAIALRPRLDFDEHARRVVAWLTGPS